jgi:hypothetical protein
MGRETAAPLPYTGFSPESRVKKDLTYIGFNFEGTGL